MKNRLFIMVLFLVCYSVDAQDIFGKWKTIDDETGEAKSIVNIYKENGKVFGKIVDIVNPERKDAICDKCEGEDKNKPIIGFVLIRNLQKDGRYYEGGTIFDPQKGKQYKCRIGLDADNEDLLQVRGYVAFFYATQYWERIKG
ncbi:hypothetical protein SAMN05421824_2606 [Hyunsoonleella jejuensis]|uniref:DUF2147 domain-containing protein n=1 Tax=Hyunsoonleella jejuensis TaxID=419940 RepID=A0A1H9JNW0_9FLAO|nr:DUF2147 domain-containing protein [Hyunsoonleella jejuensis]SEQ88496.1 hypothetical protein SAMN05421824_2606 [Hyunsoonleella jejuensis]